MSGKKKSKYGKYVFTLKNLDYLRIDQVYNIAAIESNFDNKATPPVESTQINDLTYNRDTRERISFLDESKVLHTCDVSIIDFGIARDAYHCFWCRHGIPEDATPLGCPLKYRSARAVKTYYSEISKDTYTIQENITRLRKEQLREDPDKRIAVIIDTYYDTDGVFCSFNCAKAFIDDNKSNPIYNLSANLLIKIYNDLFETGITTILSAPHWRTLKEYGGKNTIDEFRDSFYKVEYEHHGFVRSQRPIGIMYEERVKF